MFGASAGTAPPDFPGTEGARSSARTGESRAWRCFLPFALLLAACSAPGSGSPAPVEEAPAVLDSYDVVWNSPSRDASGSMPMGNGEMGLNLWAEPNGDLVFYISRTDAWSEASRLLKLGRIRLHVEPNPFAEGRAFEQRLALRDGRVTLRSGTGAERFELELFVDSDFDVVHVSASSEQPVSVRASLECWRNESRRLVGKELESSWTMRDAPESIEVTESADIDVDQPGAVVWYHRNEHSVQPLTLAHQGLSSIAELTYDPLMQRTFGGWMEGPDFAKVGPRELQSVRPARKFELSIATHASQSAQVDTWIDSLRATSERSLLEDARERSRRWWHAFWARSWIFVEGDPWPTADRSEDPRPASRITQAYLLQRWIQACGGRGSYPIKFNGSIFTVDPKFAGGPDFNPDWRRWGDAYWWQNTRLAYHAMLANGDYDMFTPLFDLYRGVLPFLEARAKLYHGAEGAIFPETMTIFGTCSNGDYGWDRAGHVASEVLCPWWQWAWNQGPELVALGLDYFDRTGDERFLRGSLLPIARATLAWFDTRFERDDAGRLVISPTQSLETYWHGVVNDLPSVVGLHEIGQRLEGLPANLLTAQDRALLLRVTQALPPIPMGTTAAGAPILAPAEKYDPGRNNCETPEIYALFPFRAARRGTELFEAAGRAFDGRHDRFTNGWPQDGQAAALLGRTAEARDNLLAKVQNSPASFRFPAMWGPNFDWLPDQCHGSNVMLTLQCMLLQEDGAGQRTSPSWPADWSVRFRLHGRDGAVVNGEHRAVR